VATLREWLDRLWGTLRRKRADHELKEELRLHLELAAEDMRSGSGSLEQAERAATLRAGGMSQAMEALRDQRGVPFLEDLARDLRHAARTLLRSPGFATVAILTLALGIGATTALFSVVDAVLLKPLPVQDPERLVVLSLRNALGERLTGFSYPLFSELQARNHTLIATFAATWGTDSMELRMASSGEPVATRVSMVSGNFFDALGVHAQIGRAISTADDQPPGAHAVAVLSDRFWKSRFGANASVLGATITINGRPFTIVGVAPPRFFGNVVGDMPDVWVPATMQPQLWPPRSFLETASTDWLLLMGRLRPGSRLSEAQADLDGVLRQIQRDWKGTVNGKGLPENATVVLTPGDKGFSELRERFARPLQILTGVVGLVLLVVCVNVANLQFARAASRQREIAVRVALGASGQRLARQFLTESLLLAVLGGLVGLLLAFWGTRALLPLLADRSGSPPMALHMDLRLLVFAALVSMATALLFGVVPATRAAKNSEGVRVQGVATGVAPPRFGKILVACQVALSLVLVTGAGLFLRTLQNLRSVDAGVDREQLLLLRVDPVATGYDSSQLAGLNHRLESAVGVVPGVRSVSQSGVGLMQGRSRICCITVPGYTPAPGERMAIRTNDVSPSYFDTVGMTVLAGRGFDDRDGAAKLRPAIVNEAFIRHYFGGGTAVGRSFGFEPNSPMEIIGVVRDARYDDLRQPSVPLAFFPRRDDSRLQSIEVRAAGDPRLLASAVRRAVAAADPRLPVREMLTMRQLVESSLAQELLLARISGVLGLLALGLACLGVYGVMAFLVARRTPEIGIRMALGATSTTVVRMIFAESALLVLGGIAFGLPAALVATRLIASQLFGVGPADPVTMGSATLLMTTLAGTAGFLPALRATRVDPVIALRSE
jgi:predicted permease